MVKSYLKFEHSKTFGQICTATANVIWDPTSSPHGDNDQAFTGSSKARAGVGQAYAPANESVIVWDLKTATIVDTWTASDNKAIVTVLCRSKTDPDVFAVGYSDGKIRVWDSRTATVIITFNGHKTAVTQLKFDRSGVRLASGSRDTDIIVWDLVSEVGLVRLRGHKDQITSLNFLSKNPDSDDQDAEETEQPDPNVFLLSTSKDALIKVWDLSTQHCIETHVTQTNGECWAAAITRDKTGCITAGNDGEVKVWTINYSALSTKASSESDNLGNILHERGTLYRHGRDRPLAVVCHPQRDLIALHGSDKSIELLRIRSENEVHRTLVRKRKRRKEKNEAVADADSGVDIPEETEDTIDISTAAISDIIVPYVIVRTGGKVRSMDWSSSRSGKSISMLVATSNNQLEVFEVLANDKKKVVEVPDYNRTLSVDMPGHRSDIRCIALSSDDRMLATASHGSLKIWNTRTQSCLRTLECGYALCLTFLPGDKIVVVGTREGTLEVFDIAASTLLDTIKAHERDVWSLQVSPQGKSLVTGSADKTAKLWEFKVIQEEVLGTNRKNPKLTLVPFKTLKVADDILCVRFSPDEKLLAVSTLDSTVKVFFADSLKLFLTLYGHKLPVLSMDISYDSKLIVTSSADKNVRVWGLDFGDCHKAFFAHQDSILSVVFVPHNNEGNGHHFFSASKDKIIKYYDADKFEQIQKVDGHHGEIWALAIANSGDFLVSASHDKSIRMWQQTDEQIFLEEEREKELEELYENTLITSLENDADHDQQVGGDGDGPEATAAGKQSAQTLMAGEKITEALELGLEDVKVMSKYEIAKKLNPKTAVPPRDPVFLANDNISASAYVLNVVQRIPAASLQDALLVLSFSQLPALFTFLEMWAAEGRNVPLTCRILLFMLKTHQKQIVSDSSEMRTTLTRVRDKLRHTVQRQKYDLGFNLAGLRVLGRRIRESAETDYVDEPATTPPTTTITRGKKRGFVTVA